MMLPHKMLIGGQLLGQNPKSSYIPLIAIYLLTELL